MNDQPLHPIIALWKAVSLDIHPWIMLAIVLAQFALTVFAVGHGVSAHWKIWSRILLSIIAAVLPVSIFQLTFQLQDDPANPSLILRFCIFYLFAVFGIIGALLSLSPHRTSLLKFWFWTITLLWLLVFLISGGILMVVGPVGLILGVVLYYMHSHLIKAVSPSLPPPRFSRKPYGSRQIITMAGWPFHMTAGLYVSTSKFLHDPFTINYWFLRKIGKFNEYHVLTYGINRAIGSKEFEAQPEVTQAINALLETLAAYPDLLPIRCIQIHGSQLRFMIPNDHGLKTSNSMQVITDLEELSTLQRHLETSHL